MKMIQRLWSDEAGFVVSSELVLIATVLVIGMLVGLSTLREQVVQELVDVADAISEVNQAYSFSAITGHFSRTGGSTFDDTGDACDLDGNNNGGPDATGVCVNVNVTPATPAGGGFNNEM